MAKLDNNGTGRWPPWSRIQSLNEMTEEAGVDFDEFIDLLKIDKYPKWLSSSSRKGLSAAGSFFVMA